MPKKLMKANNGDGSFRCRENGSYEYRVTYEDLYGRKKRKSFYGQSDIECKEKAEQFFKRLAKERGGVDLSLTIPQIARLKCEKDYRENYTKEPGYARNLETIKIIERSPLGSIPIVDVKMYMIEDFLASICGYAEKTIQKIFQKLEGAFKWAKNKQLIDVDLFEVNDIRCPRSSKPSKKVCALTVDEQMMLIDFLKNYEPYSFRNDYRLQLIIEMYSGLRMGEINALRPRDIDFKRNEIHVRGTISRNIENETILGDETKTPAGVRDVPISSKLRPYLCAALEQYKENRYGVLFYDHVHDKLISTQQVNCFYRRICEKLGIAMNGQHSLRHTFATRAIEAGVDAVVLKNWLGHKNIHVTLDTYTDVFKSLHNNAMTAMDNYMKTMAE